MDNGDEFINRGNSDFNRQWVKQAAVRLADPDLFHIGDLEHIHHRHSFWISLQADISRLNELGCGLNKI